MKNYNRAITQLNKARAEYQKLNNDDTCNKLLRAYQADRTAENEKAFDDYATTMAEQATEHQIQKIAIKLLDNNAKYALMQDTLPTIIEVINANSGKPFGEKTKERIQTEIQNKLDNNVFVYISKNDIYISNRTEDKQYSGNFAVTCYATYTDGKQNSITDGENKLQEISIDIFHTFGEVVYTANARATAKKLIALHQKALAIQEQEHAIAKEFNSLAGGSLESLKYSYSIRNYIML